MANIRVCTYEYDIDLLKVFSTRILHRVKSNIVLESVQGGRCVEIKYNEDQFAEVCRIIAEVILLDLSRIEIASMVQAYNIEAESKSTVIHSACSRAFRHADPDAVTERLGDYFARENTLVLEGYLHFMMQEEIKLWQSCVDSAIDDILLRDEYLELVRLLKAFIDIPCDDVGNVSLMLQPDGSCTLTDSQELRIESSPGCEDEMLELIISMSPSKITLYDLSRGALGGFVDSIKSIFGEIVVILS